MRAKYAVYAIPGCFPDDIVDHVTIDIYTDDPNCGECRYAAIQAAGYDFYDDHSSQSGPPYGAKFVGYDEPTIEIPFEALETIAALLNGTEQVLNDRRRATLRDMLVASGCLKREGMYVNPVRPE